MVNGSRSGVAIRSRANPGVEIGQQDHPPEAVGTLLDDPARLGPLGRERGVALAPRCGASWSGFQGSAIRSVPPVICTL